MFVHNYFELVASKLWRQGTAKFLHAHKGLASHDFIETLSIL
jgi:hypothetical protein